MAANMTEKTTHKLNQEIIKVIAIALIMLFGGRLALGQIAHNGHTSSGQTSIPRQPAYSSQLITLDMQGDLREALDALFRQSHVNYVYALRAVPAQTAHIKVVRASFDAALNTILRAYPAQPPIRPHITGTVISLMQIDLQHPSQNGKTRSVTLRLQNARLPDAFRALFATLGTDYTLDNGIQGFATLTQRDASYRSVINALIAQSAQPLTLTDNGNYLIIKLQSKKAPPKAKNRKD